MTGEIQGKIYVFDLDNTLCDTKRDADGRWLYLEAKPFHERILVVNRLFDEGNYIIIDSARGCDSGKDWSMETMLQLNGFGLKFHQLRTGVKFGADYYIDDKAVKAEDFFNGSDQ